jgi:hypothetical protein
VEIWTKTAQFLFWEYLFAAYAIYTGEREGVLCSVQWACLSLAAVKQAGQVAKVAVAASHTVSGHSK